MGEQKSQKSGPVPGPAPSPVPSPVPSPASGPALGAPPWHVPVMIEDIPETGEHFDLEADAGVRAAVASVASLRELSRLRATFDVTRRGSGGLHVLGSVSATVGQTCVVSLEPLDNEVEEAIDLTFVPRHAVEPSGEARDKPQPHDVNLDDPEPLIGGMIDLGALATEFLILGLDPYPRKPGAVFESPHDDKPDPGAFAALAKLKQRGN